MSKKVFIYSTLSNDQAYTQYVKGTEVPQVEHTINIAGKANVAGKHFLTPLGMVTEITEEDLAILKGNQMFQIHEANGFITYSNTKADPDTVASDMTGRDASAPLVEQDFENEKVEAPVSNGRRARAK